mgnify:FL=1|tara:strand:- start:1592 stop:1996 length:405 start_codon:yes stop_codon:yes gene_type:complete
MINNLKNNEVIIYDGICVLCNKYIKWVLDKDKENLFLISNLQSKFTEEKFPELRKIDSVAVIKKNGEILQKSKAVNHILKSINRLILLRIILNILPLSISNLFYDIVAKSRYKVFGKYDSCQLPEPEYKSRFIA